MGRRLDINVVNAGGGGGGLQAILSRTLGLYAQRNSRCTLGTLLALTASSRLLAY